MRINISRIFDGIFIRSDCCCNSGGDCFMIKQIKVKMAAGPLEKDSNKMINGWVENRMVVNLWWPVVENGRQISINPLHPMTHHILVSPNPARKWVYK